MNAPTVGAPRRSVLSVPGSNERFLEKAVGLDADEILFDLEDSVIDEEKPAARRKVVEAIRSLDFGARLLCVRLNGWSSSSTFRDVVEVVGGAGERLDAVMLAKTSSGAEVTALDLLLTQVEREAGRPEGSIAIEVLVESAGGLAAVDAIAGASGRIATIAVGPTDLAASLGLALGEAPEDAGSGAARYHELAVMRLVVAARAHGLQAIDGPYLRIEDEEGLRLAAGRAAALGCDGKWAIHPSQIAVLNRAFTPSSEELERAAAILAELEDAAAHERRGAVARSGEMLDEASAKRAHAVLARAARHDDGVKR